jgi:WD40 repeat protein
MPETPIRLAPLREFGRPGVAFWSVDYSPDGHHLVTGSRNGELTLWNAETGEVIHNKTESSGGAFLSAAFTPNARWIVTASEDCTARVYDATDLDVVHRFRGHLGPINCLAVSDELLVTGSADKTVKVWDLKRVEQESNLSSQ